MTEHSVDALSEYEKIRQQNIARNEEFLKNLGINVNAEQIRDTVDEPYTHRKKSKVKIKNQENDGHDILPDSDVRRSSRLSSSQKEQKLEMYDDIGTTRSKTKISKPVYDDEGIIIDDTNERKKVTASDLREYIKSNNQSHNEDISNDAIQHCIMRLQSMSNKALLTRLRRIVIYEKLLVFYYALVLSELFDLAEVAAYYLYHKYNVVVQLHVNKNSDTS